MSFDGGLSQSSSSNNTLILGGSFNPIHHGHLICARTSAEILGFGKVLLIPAGQPLLKQVSDMASGAHRLAMCRHAYAGATSASTSDNPATDSDVFSMDRDRTQAFFDVSNVEIQTNDPSYTLTTARKLRDSGMTQINWLIGADQLNSLPRWHQPEALLEEVNFIVMARPGYELNWSALPKYMQRLQAHLVQTPHLDISATHIRERVARGLPIDWLTPAGVVDYIREHGLYRGG